MKEQKESGYKEEKETYKIQEGLEAGEKEITKQKQYSGLKEGTYQIYAVIHDVSGNKTITEEKIIALGKVTDLNNENTSFTYNPTTWTNGKVTVTAQTTAQGYNIEYSTDGKTWEQKESIELSQNGSVHARLTDGINVGKSISATINNIDTNKPTVGNVQIQELTTNKITANIEIQDQESGLAKIDWYYKLATETNYTKIEQNYANDGQTGETIKTNKTLELTDILSGTYAIYAKIYDVAGNEQETETMIVETIKLPNGIGNITMEPDKTNWTNEEVTVTLSNSTPDYTIEYSTDKTNWTKGTTVTVEENGTIYARLTDGKNVGEINILEINNIDKTQAEIISLEETEKTTKSIQAQIKMQDQESGLAKIEWYYKPTNAQNYTKVEENYQTIGGNQKGQNVVVTGELKLIDIPYGTYEVYAKIYDVAGNISTTETKNITTEKLELTLLQTPEKWINESVTVTITSNIQEYTAKYSTDETNWTEGKTVTVIQNGTIYAEITDGINTERKSIEINNIDKQEPVITKEISNTHITTKGFTLEVTAKDAQSGISQIDWYYKKDNQDDYKIQTSEYTQMNGTEPGSTQVEGKATHITSLAYGTYEVYAKIYDVAGNSSKTEKITITLKPMESLTPENTNFVHTPSTWTNGDVTVTASTELAQGDFNIQMSTNGSDWLDTNNVIVGANQKVYARLWDGVNAGTETETEIINIDKTIATINLSCADEDITTRGFTIKVSGTDGDADSNSGMSGISAINTYYKNENEEQYKELATFSYKDQHIVVTETGNQTQEETINTEEALGKGLTTGTYNVYVEIYDVAGNKNTSEISITLKPMESLTPENTNFVHNPATWTNGDVTVTASTNLATGAFSIQTSTDNQNWDNTTIQTLAGNGKVYARLWDGLNYGTETYTQVSKIDKNATTININCAEENITTRGFTIDFTATDADPDETYGMSGISEIKFYYKKASASEYTNLTTYTYATMNGTESGTKQTSGKMNTETELKFGLEAGTYNIYAESYDVAGTVTRSETLTITLKQVETLTQENTTITHTPTTWTNGNVTVTANSALATTTPNYTTEEFSIQTSQDNQNWANTTMQTVEGNGTVYVRLWDGVNGGTPTSKTITNIDKALPTINLNNNNTTTRGFTITITGTDADQTTTSGMSGISAINCYYKLSTASTYSTLKTYTYKTINGSETGNKTQTETINTEDIIVGGLKTGTYDIYVEVYDVAGNKQTYTTNITLKTVTALTAENTSLTLSPSGWTNGNVTVTASTSLAKTNPNYATGEFSIQTSKDNQNWENTTSQTLTTNGKVYARLWDGINAGQATNTDVTKIDKTLPTINTLSSSNVTTRGFEITVTGTDSSSGISSINIYYSKDGGTYQTLKTYSYTTMNGSTAGATSKTETINTEDILGGLTYGKYDIKVQVYDVAGNVREATTSIQLKAVPNLTTSNTTFTQNPATGWTNNRTVTVTSTVASGYTIQTNKDGQGWASTSSVNFTTNGTLYARLTDGINVGGQYSQTITQTENTKPTISAALTASNITSKSFTLSVGAKDEGSVVSGISKIEWYYKLSTASSYTLYTTTTYTTMNGSTAGATTKTATQNLTGLKTGTYDVKARVYDVAGNYTESTKTGIALKTITLTLTPSTTSNTNGNVTVTLASNITTDGYSVQYSLDGGSTWTTGASVTMTTNGMVHGKISDGTNTKTTSYTVGNIDKKAPSATISNIGVDKATKTITATITHTDTSNSSYKASGVNIGSSKWVITTSATALGTTASNYTGGFSSNPQTISATVGSGTYYIHVLTVDNVGNAIETISSEIKVNTAPEAASVTFNSRGTDYIALNATSTDADGDTLTYKLYYGTSASSLSEVTTSSATAASGTSVALGKSSLSSYTTYYFRVDVSDGTATTTGSIYSCGTLCAGGSEVPCTTCGGDNKVTCTVCGGDGTYECGGSMVLQEWSIDGGNGFCSTHNLSYDYIWWKCSDCGDTDEQEDCTKCIDVPSYSYDCSNSISGCDTTMDCDDQYCNNGDYLYQCRDHGYWHYDNYPASDFTKVN